MSEVNGITENIPEVDMLPSADNWLDLVAHAKNHGILEKHTPKGVRVQYSSHSTGRHLHIFLELDGFKDLLVYYRTEWYSSSYQFNERGKIAGHQPDTDYAKPILNKMFSSIFSELQDIGRQNRIRRIRENSASQDAEKIRLTAFKQAFSGDMGAA